MQNATGQAARTQSIDPHDLFPSAQLRAAFWRAYGGFPEAIQGRPRKARHKGIVRLAQSSRQLGTGDVLLGGKRGAAHVMFTTQLGTRNPALYLTHHAHDLGFFKSGLLHRNLLVHPAEKILPSHLLNHGEDCPIASIQDAQGCSEPTTYAQPPQRPPLARGP